MLTSLGFKLKKLKGYFNMRINTRIHHIFWTDEINNKKL